jgi:hypothetical protein
VRGSHTDEAIQMEAPKSSPNVNIKMTESPGGQEIYSSTPVQENTSDDNVAPALSRSTPSPAIVEEEDDLDALVKPGTACLHKGCGTMFVSDELNRKGDGPEAVCTYHPSPVRMTFFTLRTYLQHLLALF